MDNPMVEVRFFSETLGQEVGRAYIKTLRDAIEANAKDPAMLEELRLAAAEAMARAEQRLYECRRRCEEQRGTIY